MHRPYEKPAGGVCILVTLVVYFIRFARTPVPSLRTPRESRPQRFALGGRPPPIVAGLPTILKRTLYVF
jgi:hypothetical protein